MKRICVSTGIYSIILVILSVGSQIGNWPDDYLKKTILWILPSVFAFFVGMDTAASYASRKKTNIDKTTQLVMTIWFSFIILMFSIFSNINHWPANWLDDTIVWLFPSGMSFYLGMGTEIRHIKKVRKIAKSKDHSKPVAETKVEKAPTPMVSERIHNVYVPEISETDNNDNLMPIVFDYDHDSYRRKSTEKRRPEIIILSRAECSDFQ